MVDQQIIKRFASAKVVFQKKVVDSDIMASLFAFLSLLLVVYLIALKLRFDNRDYSMLIRSLRWLALALTIVLAVSFIMSVYEVYFAWYWFPRIIFICWFFNLIILGSLTKKFRFTLLEKIVYWVGFRFTLFIALLFCVPFLGGAIIVTFYPKLIGSAEMIKYEDSKIRVEQSHIIFMDAGYSLNVYSKGSIFSHPLRNLVEARYAHNSKFNVTFSNDSVIIHTYDTAFRSNYDGDTTIAKLRYHAKENF